MKKKEKALAAEEDELVKARVEVTRLKEAHVTHMNHFGNLEVLNNDKDVRIKKLEDENEELKIVSQEFKEKVEQMEEKEKEKVEKGATRTPEKKRKLIDSRGSSTDRDYSTPGSSRSTKKEIRIPTLIG